MDRELIAKANGLADNLAADRAGGLSSGEILLKRMDEIKELAGVLPWAAILPVVPIIWKLLMAIAQERREGKTWLEAIFAHAAEALELVLKVVSLISKDEDTPVVPSIKT